MSLMNVYPCLVCDDRHETRCQACHGMGLLRASAGACNEWNLCERCEGSGVVDCPVCVDASGVLREFPTFGSAPPVRVVSVH